MLSSYINPEAAGLTLMVPIPLYAVGCPVQSPSGRRRRPSPPCHAVRAQNHSLMRRPTRDAIKHTHLDIQICSYAPRSYAKPGTIGRRSRRTRPASVFARDDCYRAVTGARRRRSPSGGRIGFSEPRSLALCARN